MNADISSAKQEVQRLLQKQLAAARRAHRPVASSLKRIIDRIEDLGMDLGFVPVEILELKRGFKGAMIVIAFADYQTEVTVAV